MALDPPPLETQGGTKIVELIPQKYKTQFASAVKNVLIILQMLVKKQAFG